MSEDPELEAMAKTHSLLEPLSEEARARVLAWVIGRLKIPQSASLNIRSSVQAVDEGTNISTDEPGNPEKRFSSFGEFFDAAQPKNPAENVLIAAYWIQFIQQNPDLTGHAINSELKHIGHEASNVTASLSQLMNRRPALALQIRKSGKSQQSRKKYKLTEAGIKEVQTRPDRK
jgi:hypothetical protein